MKIAIIPKTDFDVGYAHSVANQLRDLAEVIVLSDFTPVTMRVTAAFEAHDYVFLADAADGRGGTVTKQFYRDLKPVERLTVPAIRQLLKGG